MRSKNDDLYWNLINNYGQSDFIASIAASRGWVTEENFANFINPKIKDEMPDPFVLKDMSEATEFVQKSIKNKEKIAIFADYDVDGATSAAILYRFFKFCGIEVEIYVPDRIKEGYGPNSNALLNLRKKGIDLVITVDCGTVAFEPLEKAAQAGLKVIVIDHHLGVKEKPNSIAVINPNRYDETSDLTYLCGAGVSFMFCVAMAKILQKNELKNQIMNLLDLVALGTICDVVGLKGLNRAFVKTGLKIANLRQNSGLVALSDAVGLDKTINARDFGFSIGPMINAGGRIGRSDMGANILSSESENFVKNMALELKDLNLQRREIESKIVDEAVLEIEKHNCSDLIIFTYSANWHEGVIGIVASRIKDKTYKPTLIGSIIEHEGITCVKASCRSIYGVNIGEAVVEAVYKGLLIKGGGHGMAAGFTMDLAKKEDFMSFLTEKLGKDIEIARQQRVVEFDYYLSLAGANTELCDLMEQLEPFGTDNPEPIFVLKNVTVLSGKIAKDMHVSVLLKCQQTGAVNNAICFRCVNSALGDLLLGSKGKQIDILCKLDTSLYLGQKKVNIVINDARAN